MICKAGMTKFCKIWTNENCRYVQRASNVYNIQRGEIFPKSDTHICQDDKYIALGFVLFEFDCVRRDLNSHVN